MNYRVRRFVSLLAWCLMGSAFINTTYAEGVSLIVSAEDTIANAGPAQWALSQLHESLQAEGVDTTIHSQIQATPAGNRCVVVAGRSSSAAVALLKQQGVTVPDTPEALGLVEGSLDGRPVLLACGSDARGLSYALLELADRIQCGIAPAEALTVSKPVVEQPALKVRSIYRPFTSEIEDKPWYNDRAFWKSYLTELAKDRINRFSLAFGMGYNNPRGCIDSYFFFAYPFLVDVPGYDVRAVGLPDEERDHNLDMLRFISDEAAARGIDFQLALWSHGYNFPKTVNYPIAGLPPEDHAAYCRDALTMLLKACPAISGITYRVHGESGVKEGTQGFWNVLFEAHKTAGRPVWIDMHGKHLTQDQLNWALATGMPVSASPKYVGEHMGLGYHPADVRHREKGDVAAYVEPSSGVHLTRRQFTRSGYGDFLPEDRNWDVLHRIWPGTNVLLLSGDPAQAASFGRTSGVFGSLGVERCDPLSFKGRKGSGHPGGRCAYADTSLNPTWDFQKFLYTYRVWGRLLYNPDADPDVWMRFLRNRFGKAAAPMATALANSSRVVHLITTAHGAATDCTVYWPEIYMNMPIVKESDDNTFRDNPSPKVFGNVSPHDPQLFGKMNDFAAALLKGETAAKYSPLMVAQWLDDMAETATANLTRAESLVADKTDVEFRRFDHDITIQCGIARFFADKMRAAVLWHLYKDSGDSAALVDAIKHYTAARNAWAEMAEEAKSVYVKDITFGNRPVERGCWADRVPAMDADIADMKAALAGVGETSHTQVVREAIQTVNSRPHLPVVQASHTPAKSFQPGTAMKIELKPQEGVNGVTLYYRHANQAINWQQMPMQKSGDEFDAVIPAKYTQTRYPMQYYFAINTGEPGKAIFPGLDENLAGMPYFVVRQNPSMEAPFSTYQSTGE